LRNGRHHRPPPATGITVLKLSFKNLFESLSPRADLSTESSQMRSKKLSKLPPPKPATGGDAAHGESGAHGVGRGGGGGAPETGGGGDSGDDTGPDDTADTAAGAGDAEADAAAEAGADGGESCVHAAHARNSGRA